MRSSEKNRRPVGPAGVCLRVVLTGVLLAGQVFGPAVVRAEPGDHMAWNLRPEDRVLEELAKGLGIESYHKHVQDLVAELKRRDAVYSRRSEPVRDLVLSLFRSIRTYAAHLRQCHAFYEEVVNKVGKEDQKPFDALLLRREKLLKKAERSGALLPPEIAVQIQTRSVPKGVRKFFGTPEYALTFDAQLIATIKEYHQEQNAIYADWEAERAKYESNAKAYLAEKNTELEKRLNAFIAMLSTHRKYFDEIATKFRSGEDAHCLGEPPPVGGGYTVEGATFAAVPKHTGAKLTDIPGMEVSLYSLQTLRNQYKAFPEAKAPGEPAELLFYRDGPQTLERWAEKEEAALEGARWEYLAESVEVPRYVCQTCKDFGVGMVEGVYQPFEHLADSEQTWSEALYNTGKELTYDNAMGVLQTGCELVEDLYKVTKSAHDKVIDTLEKGTSSPEGAAEVLGDLYDAARDELTRELRVMQLMEPMFDDDRPPSGASPEQWIEYADSLRERTDSLESETEILHERGEWFKKHVVDNSVKALQLYMAGKGGASTLRNVRSFTSKSWNKLKSNQLKRDLDLKRTDVARDILDRKKAGQDVPPEVVRAAEDSANFQKIMESDRLRGDKIKALEDAATRDLAEMQQRSATRKAPFEHQDTVTLRDGSPVQYGQQLGDSGSFKTTFEHVDPKKVVQIVDDVNKSKQLIHRERISAERLDAAGVDRVRVHEQQVLADGRAVKVVERIDGDTLADAKLKKQGGKFDAEQEAAIQDMFDRLNDNDLIWTDPNPGNFCFVRDGGGRLRCKVVDMDGVVDVKQIIAENGNDFSLLDVKKSDLRKLDLKQVDFDLTSRGDIGKVQRMIAGGDEQFFQGKAPEGSNKADLTNMNNDNVGSFFGTEGYTLGEPVPRSIGSLETGTSASFRTPKPGSASTTLGRGRTDFVIQRMSDKDAAAHRKLSDDAADPAGAAQRQLDDLQKALDDLVDQDTGQAVVGVGIPHKGKGGSPGTSQHAAVLEVIEEDDDDEPPPPLIETLPPIDFRTLQGTTKGLDADLLF